MTELTLVFIVTNAFLLGLGIAGLVFVKNVLSAAKATLEGAVKAKDDTVKICHTVSDAHNGLARRIVEVEDRIKGQELKLAQKQFTSAR